IQSQRAGLSTDVTTPESGIVHADLSGKLPWPLRNLFNDTGETESEKVRDDVVNLLLTSVRPEAGKYKTLPDFTPSNVPEVKFEKCPDALQITQALAPSGTISITPASGTIVHPGDTVSISFSVTGGNAVDGALVNIGGGILRMEGQGPFSLSYVVP